MYENVMHEILNLMLEHSNPQSPEYYKATENLTTREDELIATFSEQQRDLYDEVRKSYDQCRDLESAELLYSTLKVAFKIMAS